MKAPRYTKSRLGIRTAATLGTLLIPGRLSHNAEQESPVEATETDQVRSNFARRVGDQTSISRTSQVSGGGSIVIPKNGNITSPNWGKVGNERDTESERVLVAKKMDLRTEFDVILREHGYGVADFGNGTYDVFRILVDSENENTDMSGPRILIPLYGSYESIKVTMDLTYLSDGVSGGKFVYTATVDSGDSIVTDDPDDLIAEVVVAVEDHTRLKVNR